MVTISLDDPVMSMTSSASWRIVNSTGLPMLIGPVVSAEVSIRDIAPGDAVHQVEVARAQLVAHAGWPGASSLKM